jgi:hypothetical protein
MLASAKKFDVAKVNPAMIASSGGPPPAEE